MCNCKNKNSSEKCICYLINKFDELEALVLNMETVEDTNLPRIVSGSLDAETGIATFVRDDATEIPVDLSALLGTIAFIEGTYAEIKAIKDADALIPGLTYIINDYQTEYFIEGSNSSGIVEEKEISSVVSGYAVLNNDYEYDLNVGDTVEVTELPSGYSGAVQVGDTTTVTVETSDYYFRFANNMHNTVGIKFKFFYDRYNTIAQDIVVNDANGKPVLRPQGVINTEVHDGTPYMEQTAAENYPVPVERVVLIASDTNSFRKEGESDTFQGDYLEYDIDDTDIINDNNEVIGTRKGLITRRATFDRSIDAPIDWRVFRFRRWLLD
ncbi:MAG: hypothetical protein PQJ49_14180, partial [Sphaerochaetaceae bacterium]|nr:hypothetical protein [Sphaerochaetaceae bacterium]